jgi:uncharacterized protein (DUF1800 family)
MTGRSSRNTGVSSRASRETSRIFARHFVADDPQPTLLARLEDVFRKTEGDLRALTTALVDSDEGWQAPLTKLRSPMCATC